jgi:hypothetical protein
MPTSYRSICHPRVYLTSDMPHACPSKVQGVARRKGRPSSVDMEDVSYIFRHQPGKYRLIYERRGWLAFFLFALPCVSCERSFSCHSLLFIYEEEDIQG